MANFDELKNKFLSSLGKAAEAGKDIAVKAADAGKDIAVKASEKAKCGTRIAKLSIDVAGEKDNMKKAYLEIGKLYYDTHKDDPEGFFIQLCEEVTLARSNIEAMEKEIAELKGGTDDEENEDPDVTVEFENIVSGDEAAAEPEIVIAGEEEPEKPCTCGCTEEPAEKPVEESHEAEEAAEESPEEEKAAEEEKPEE